MSLNFLYVVLFAIYFVLQKHEQNKFEVSNSCNKLIHEKLPRINTKNYQLIPVTILLRLDCLTNSIYHKWSHINVMQTSNVKHWAKVWGLLNQETQHDWKVNNYATRSAVHGYYSALAFVFGRKINFLKYLF